LALRLDVQDQVSELAGRLQAVDRSVLVRNLTPPETRIANEKEVRFQKWRIVTFARCTCLASD